MRFLDYQDGFTREFSSIQGGLCACEPPFEQGALQFSVKYLLLRAQTLGREK
jgi:hypothetical protein